MAGLNIPHRSELPHGTFLGDLNRARLDAQQKATDIGNEAVAVGADLMLGEDTGDDMLTDLAYGAIPGGSLYQRAKTGTRPGALDLMDLIPGGGTAAKAATMFVPMDLVRSLAKRAGAKGFESKFKRLPKAVQESWISSFGDVHSNKLQKQRGKISVSDKIDHSLVHAYPKLNTEYSGTASYYIPFENSVRDLGYYQPYISLDRIIDGDELVGALLHEGTHLMDNSMGTAKEVVNMPSNWRYAHPYSGHVSKDWIDASTINRHPLAGSRKAQEYQDITGDFSPLEYAYAKNHPLENPGSDPDYWLADDPHGLEFYKNRQYYDWEGNPEPRTIDEDAVAREGFSQFVESIPFTDLGKTPARRKLVEFAERDPRRSEDFTINFDRMEDYLRQPADKYDAEIKRNVVPYITSF
jgi:hypothetical protein